MEKVTIHIMLHGEICIKEAHIKAALICFTNQYNNTTTNNATVTFKKDCMFIVVDCVGG